jgi:hypothetical protein
MEGGYDTADVQPERGVNCQARGPDSFPTSRVRDWRHTFTARGRELPTGGRAPPLINVTPKKLHFPLSQHREALPRSLTQAPHNPDCR